MGDTQSRTVWAAVAVVAVAAVVGVYAVPKLVALNRVPNRMDVSVDAAGRYNAGLERVGQLESATSANLAALDRIRTTLTQVLASLGATGGDLGTAAARAQHDLTTALDPTGPALDRLAASLADLDAKTKALGPPLASSAAALDQARAALAIVQADAAGVAGSVHDARVATDGAATNVFGPSR